MIEIPGKGKGKLDNGGLDRLPYLLARVDEILEQKRREAEAHEDESGARSEEQPDADPSKNGAVRPLTTHHNEH